MGKRKKRSPRQLEAAKRGNKRNAEYWNQKRQEEQSKKNLEQRRDEIHRQRRGHPRTFFVLLLLFLQIINVQLLDGVTRYEAVGRVAAISDMNRWKLMPVYTHFMKTGKVLVSLIKSIYGLSHI